MRTQDPLRRWWQHIELMLVGPLEPGVRGSMHVDIRAASAHSLIATIINFIPIILRRLGASTEQLAYYHAVTALGLLTTSFSIWLMRRWGMRRVALLGWLLGRGSLLLAALVSGAPGLLVILTLFWVLEAWPVPAYLQAMQTIYPAGQRGRIMALVRVVLVGITLVFTPLAGWILDLLGYRVLLPLGALSGISSTLIFYRLLRNVPDTISTAPPSAASPWRIVQLDRRMPLYLAGALLFGLAILIPAPLYPAVQVDRLDLSYTAVGLLSWTQSLFWFLGYLFGGRLLDRLGGIRSLQIVCVINVCVALPYAWASQSWMLLPSFIATGLVTAGADLATLYTVIHLAGPARVPAYSAVNSTVAGLRGLLGPFIGAWLVRAGLPFGLVFGLSAVLTLAAAGLLAFVGRFKAPAEAGL